MASSGKKKTTMAKLNRESKLRERRAEKEARKRARKDAAADLANQVDAPQPGDDLAEDSATDAADATDEVAAADTDHPAVAGPQR
jgi:hypothetical protein